MDVRSKNQPKFDSGHDTRGTKKGNGVRTDRHEEKGYPFVPRVRHSHIRRSFAVRRRLG
jgi:hypothetical protein